MSVFYKYFNDQVSWSNITNVYLHLTLVVYQRVMVTVMKSNREAHYNVIYVRVHLRSYNLNSTVKWFKSN